MSVTEAPADSATGTGAATATDAPAAVDAPGAVAAEKPTPLCAPGAAEVAEMAAQVDADPEAPVALGIAEVADRTGISAHTLRYYERIGLLSVPRDGAGRRIYTDAELARVVFITRLRLTAMPIREIQAYFRLVEQGPGNEPERLALLERHRDEVQARMGELRSALEAIEYKIALYGGSCTP